MMMSKFREFASAAGDEIPDEPKVMSSEKIHFTAKMVIDELLELYASSTTPDIAKKDMIRILKNAKDVPKEPEPTVTSQADALCDILCYLGHQAAIHGYDLDSVLEEVHSANMKKRDPITKKFLRRPEDNKVIKPQNWIGPDISKALYQKNKKSEFPPLGLLIRIFIAVFASLCVFLIPFIKK